MAPRTKLLKTKVVYFSILTAKENLFYYFFPRSHIQRDMDIAVILRLKTLFIRLDNGSISWRNSAAMLETDSSS